MKEYLTDYHVKFVNPNRSIKKNIQDMKRYRNKVIMVWGYCDQQEIYEYAQNNKVPYYRIEDGFVRSVQLGAEKSVPLSICIDSQALYYDATSPSDLEDILNTYDFSSDRVLMERASKCIEMIKQMHISKYNNVTSKDIASVYGPKTKRRVLVIGQVEDDQSIQRGCERRITNNELVMLAARENPDAEIIYKPHPDVLFGKRPMQSNPEDVKHIAKVISEPLSLNDSFQTIDHVYTITSLAGFEALLQGIPVTTIGAPFYAGWGLTDSRQKTERRKRTLRIEEVFAGAYLLYPKYMHPVSKQFITLEEAINVISHMRGASSEIEEDNFVTIVPREEGKIGIFSKGIQEIPHLQSFLKGEVVFKPKENPAELSYVAGWGMKPSTKKALEFCRQHNIPYLSLEDGFLRSIGLGVNGSPPLSICIDHVGIYYDATRPSRLENILNSQGWNSEELMDQARKAMNFITDNYLSKYNHAPMINTSIFKDTDKKRVLVVDQTYGDMSITLGLADQKRFVEMYLAARKENPEAHIYIKTHPDVISGKKQGNILDIDIDANTTFIYEDCNPISLIQEVDKVYVVTSQLGFEALMLGKEVHCFGAPFYAGWGATKDRILIERRNKSRTVEEIFAAAYLLYPRYVNPVNGNPGTIFDVISYLIDHKKHNKEAKQNIN
ncbi:hypothetical protein [Ectobacillus antri]|uniref:capsular polysaccharide export protein, LipB/KpsS family n=1 Tax=Ectobacillus antri TaxID=2486280 RepID=UPI001FEABB1E|nr:hypothetical protein [Ectobacillus antri]